MGDICKCKHFLDYSQLIISLTLPVQVAPTLIFIHFAASIQNQNVPTLLWVNVLKSAKNIKVKEDFFCLDVTDSPNEILNKKQFYDRELKQLRIQELDEVKIQASFLDGSLNVNIFHISSSCSRSKILYSKVHIF